MGVDCFSLSFLAVLCVGLCGVCLCVCGLCVDFLCCNFFFVGECVVVFCVYCVWSV